VPTRSVVCPLHVGREDEIASVRASLEAVRDGGRTLLIGGEAGVGKSRLAGEAARMATAEGFLTLSGACTEGVIAAFSPLVAALRRYTRIAGEAGLRELFDGPARLATTLLPEVAEQLAIPTSDETATPEDLHAATWHVFRRLGQAQPVLLLLEDLHWADPDTLRLVAHLVREAPTLPLWLVVTYRIDELHRRHPLTPVLAQLRRGANVDEVRLAALERENVRVMVSALFGGTTVSDEFVDALRGRTSGNPFFVEELCTVLVERGDIYQRGDDWDRRSLDQIELPETVRETLLARVAPMNDSTTRLLRLAAVAGERIDAETLAIAADTSRDAVESGLVEALEHQLLEERRDGGPPHYAFRHALTREALADDLVGPQRQRAHRRIAEALASVHAADPDAAAAEISDHFAEAGVADQAAIYALRAARRAARLHAPAAAGVHFSRAIGLLADNAPERLELLLEAADATFTDEDRAASTAFAREARTLAQERDDRVAEARALRYLWQDRWRAADSEGALVLTREALALVEGRDDWNEAWTLHAVIRHLALSGSGVEEARQLLPRALELAARAGHDEALSQLHNTRGVIAADEDEAIQAFEEAARHARAAGLRGTEVGALNNDGYTSLWFGNLRRAREVLTRASDLADQLHGRDRYVHAGLAWAHSLTGDYEAALAGALPLRASTDIPARMVALTALTEVALRRGAWDEALDYARENWRLAEANGEDQRVEPALAYLARAQLSDDPHGGDDVIDRILEGSFHPFTHSWVSPDLVNALVQQRDDARLARLRTIIGQITRENYSRNNRAAMALCEGIARAAEDAFNDPRPELEQAVALYRSMPWPAREAEALLALADVEGRAGRAAESAVAARAAQAIAKRLESPPLAEAADAVLGRGSADLVLATVLMTDMVGSTQLAARLGNRAWRELLERHHAIVRRELERHHGRELDTAGDGFVAAFDSPARAIRCARAAVAALRGADIEIRAGLHTGECEVVGDKLAGIVVHTAARVAAAAGAGEVLVSATVRDLVAGAGFVFEERGTRELRGIPGEWRLYAVR
jgi:class 3 adenylate cyclase